MTYPSSLATPEHRVRISILWVCVVLNIVLADIVGFLHPGVLERIMTGSVGFVLTQELLLVFSVLLQIPVAMVFLSRVLTPRLNRWLNTAAVLLTALFVVGAAAVPCRTSSSSASKCWRCWVSSGTHGVQG